MVYTKENSKIKEGVRIDETVTRIFKGASLRYTILGICGRWEDY